LRAPTVDIANRLARACTEYELWTVRRRLWTIAVCKFFGQTWLWVRSLIFLVSS
jgi:hypothetical protein